MLRVFIIVHVLFVILGFKLSFAMEKEKANEQIKVGQLVLINPARLAFKDYYEGIVKKVTKKGGYKVTYLRRDGKKCDAIKATYEAHDLIPSVLSYKEFITGKKIIDKENHFYKTKVIFTNGIMRVKRPNHSNKYVDINNAEQKISPELEFLSWLNKKGKFYLGGSKKSHNVYALFENGTVIYDYKNESKYRFINYTRVFPDPRPTLKPLEKEEPKLIMKKEAEKESSSEKEVTKQESVSEKEEPAVIVKKETKQ